MQDWYQVPALLLAAMLLPAFGQLYWRTRDTRNLLWFLGFVFTVGRLLLVYPYATMDALNGPHPWRTAAAQCCALIAAALFLGSLSPLSFRIGRLRVLYALAFTLPLVAYTVLAHALFRLGQPDGIWTVLFGALGFLCLAVGLMWALTKGSLPLPIGVLLCVLFGGTATAIFFRTGLFWPLVFAEAGCNLLMALLVISVFRRFSPGVLISVLGFVLWSAPVLRILPYFHQPHAELVLVRCALLARVAAALGLLLLALENELETNRAAVEREHRARHELEVYGSLTLQRRRVEDFDHQAHEICAAVAGNSRFSQAALLLLQPLGHYRLAGSAGLDGAVVRAVDALAVRLPVNGFLREGSAPAACEGGQTVALDLAAYLQPGDDLAHLGFTSALAIPLRGRTTVEGALLLSGLRGSERLRADDMVPLEMFAARMQAVRSHTRMLEKLIDAEKFAGLGQLAGNVFTQLNNPLTVILGYASLLEEGHLDIPSRRGVDAILKSARSMRSTLESLQRVTRSPGGQLTAASVEELLEDMERLHRSEFLQRGIEFRVSVAEGLPRILCQPQQLRQAILHCLQFSMDAVERMETDSERMVRLEASAKNSHVQIMVAHTGPGFEKPDRAFDPFVPPRTGGAETAGLGLSLCATVLRDSQGQASAVNLQPTGAAIILDLKTA